MNALDLLYLFGAGVTAPWWMRKSRADWDQRLGKLAPLPQKTRPRLMLHAVSVGETNALRHLVPLLTPHIELVISVGTDTGIARARELYGSRAHVVRYPLDFSKSVARFLDAVSPDAVGLVELEVWPNFVAACSRRGVPVAVINGRLSERSFRGYRKVRALMRRTFGTLAFAAVQDDAYAGRFAHMGVDVSCIRVTGSMKWDAAKIETSVAGADELANEMGIDRGKPLVVAGSTAEDEEALLQAACPAGAQLLCAPRKPEHFAEAAQALPGCVRRSAKERKPGATRFLLDTIGELRKAYALADVVVLGRSFGALYGSDPTEPAALGKPVLIGPRDGDFVAMTAALEQAGGLVRVTRGSLAGVLGELVSDAAKRRAIGERAVAGVKANQGASLRHAEMLLELVRGKTPDRG